MTVDGVEWPTSEHFFQGQKFRHISIATFIAALPPTEVGALSVQFKQFWDPKFTEDQILQIALITKFSDTQLRQLLLSTTGKPVVAVGDPTNKLGKLLENLRSSL